MRTIKNIIILGAGASASEGAPTQDKLFPTFFGISEEEIGKWEQTWSDQKEVKLLRKFFKDFWGLDVHRSVINKEKFPTFEECLGMLDQASLRRECFKGYNHEKIGRLRNVLILVMAKAIQKTLLHTGSKNHHLNLVMKLKEQKELEKTAFISLNYDILIDTALVSVYPEFHLDYGLEFVNFERKYDWERPIEDKSVLLLKVHGSLNWLFCPTCNQIERTGGKERAIKAFSGTEKCKDCSTPLEPVVIPPTFYKDLSNPFINTIFLKTEQVLKQAKKIFFCGYSFPDADLHLKYLLKRMELYAGTTPEIYVINKEKQEGNENVSEEEKNWETKKEDIKKRFKRFFKDKNKVCIPNWSFEEFSKKGIQGLPTTTDCL